MPLSFRNYISSLYEGGSGYDKFIIYDTVHDLFDGRTNYISVIRRYCVRVHRCGCRIGSLDNRKDHSMLQKERLGENTSPFLSQLYPVSI